MTTYFLGRTYNFPIQLWLMDSFPFTPPICFLRPTSNMVIREGKHVDAKGRIHLPGLHNWDYVCHYDFNIHLNRPVFGFFVLFVFFS